MINGPKDPFYIISTGPLSLRDEKFFLFWAGSHPGEIENAQELISSSSQVVSGDKSFHS